MTGLDDLAARGRRQSLVVLCAAACVALLVAQAGALLAMGLPAICACGRLDLWHGNPSGPETSQHLVDWYTYTHVIHGFGFYLLLRLVAPRQPVAVRLVLAVAIEVGWEIVENTPLIMDRYRQSALARGYFGDSVVNSVADTIAAAAGFMLASVLRARTIVALTVAMELFALAMIRDNLTLNIIQLVHPSEAISRWQEGGGK